MWHAGIGLDGQSIVIKDQIVAIKISFALSGRLS